MSQEESIIQTYVQNNVPLSGCKKIHCQHHELIYGEPKRWGTVIRETDILDPIIDDIRQKKNLIGSFRGTCISGNDLLASVLYTIGIVTVVAQQYAPISLFLICVFLWFYQYIYSEVCMAIPVNGGSYNCLLNATKKSFAIIAACLSFLSYTATAVVSASSCTSYLYGQVGRFNPYWATIGILGIFALITLLGIRESSIVASIIFSFHCLTLFILIIMCLIFLIKDKGNQLSSNFHYPSQNVGELIYYGFSAGLLGITGFETAANFIQNQKPNAFPKIMRNMWTAVLIYNPTISLLSLAVLPIEQFSIYSNDVLSIVAQVAGGSWLSILVTIDATMVLGGNTLTAFVGITGLIERLSSDRCIPQFFTKINPLTRTPHFIIIAFFLLTSSLYMIVDGNLTSLAGVFTVAFLSVMCMFAVGNMILKYKRPNLKRPVVARWLYVFLGFSAMFSGLIGNIVLSPIILLYAAIYFLIPLSIIIININFTRIMKIILYFCMNISCFPKSGINMLIQLIRKSRQHEVVFFTKTDDIHILNKAVLYCQDNECCDKMKIVHFYDSEEQIPPLLIENHYILDNIYTNIEIDLVLIKGSFTPQLVKGLSEKWKILPSFMFIRCPKENFPYHVGDFGGIRIIMN